MQRPGSKKIFVSVLFLFVALVLVSHIAAQCIDHPEGKTALIFNNQSSYELTFYIDDDKDGFTLPSKQTSGPIDVDDGEHLLRAGTIIGSQELWIWVINDVPGGQICTWTVEDPPTLVAFPGRRAL